MLIDVARRSLDHGLRTGRPLPVDPAAFPPELRVLRASFVTLRCAGALRGCIGTLEPESPLVVGVADNAFKAGFRDPRFPPLNPSEMPEVRIGVSLLTPLERLAVSSERELVRRLRPGVDGLLLRGGGRQGTFLPSVWTELPDPEQFVEQLKRKAGIPSDEWPAEIEAWRYRAEPAD